MSTATIDLAIKSEGAQGIALARNERIRWAIGSALGDGEADCISLSATAFTALSPPSGARALLILPGSAVSLTLRGVSGDTGISLSPSSNPIGLPVLLPLSSASVGIYNGSSVAQLVSLIWL